MWHDTPFSQRYRTTERTVGVEVGGDKEVRERGLDKIWKRRGVSNIGGLHKKGEEIPFANYLKRLKISHPRKIKPTPCPILGSPPPPFLVKISHPLIRAIFEKSHPLLFMKGWRGVGLFNPFQVSVPFLYLLKMSENFWFSDVFRSYGDGTLAWIGLRKVNWVSIGWRVVFLIIYTKYRAVVPLQKKVVRAKIQ